MSISSSIRSPILLVLLAYIITTNHFTADAAAADTPKVKSLTLCTAAYEPNGGNSASSAGADVFTCVDGTLSGTKVGVLTWVCGIPGNPAATGQNGLFSCTHTLQIGQGCVIVRTGMFDATGPLPAAAWLVNGINGLKCPLKNTAIAGLTVQVTPPRTNGVRSVDKLTLLFKTSVKIPLA